MFKYKYRNFTIFGIFGTITLLLLLFNINERKKFIVVGNNPKSISDTLFSSVKILCLIFTSKKEIFNRAIHINATWAQRCNKFLFLSYHKKINLPYLDLKLIDKRNHLWNKLRIALKWAYENELNNYDFFLRADDDSYYVMENLRFMLLPYNPMKPYYFGARFHLDPSNEYMSGGAGIILSREALKQIGESLDNSKICEPPSTINYHDDVQLGVCAKNLNIVFVDTRDHLGRHRMLPWSPEAHFVKLLSPIHLQYFYYPYKQDQRFESCSEHMISFHYVYKETIYLLEFLFYHTKLITSADNQWYNIIEDKHIKNLSMIEKLKFASVKLSSDTFL